MRILILGASGMAGHVMARLLREQHPHSDILTHVRKDSVDENSIVMDLYDEDRKALDREAIDIVLNEAKPDVCINCVGILVRGSEENPDLARAINSELPHYLSPKCRLIHISTDCVFSGKDHRAPYTESAPTTAQTVYGRTKAAGELYKNEKGLTVRTSIIGPELRENGSGLFEWMMRQEGEINGWSNAFWNGVTTLELAKFVSIVIASDSLDSTGRGYLKGLVHLHSSDPVSKLELLRIINDVYDKGLTINSHEVAEVIDKSLKSTRERMNFTYERKPIRQLVEEQNGWYQE